MKIYHYHPDTGEYLGEGKADLSPLDLAQGREVWLIPGCATSIKPKPAAKGTVQAWHDGAWVSVPDHRGEVWYTPEGIGGVINTIGDPVAAGLSATAPAPKLDANDQADQT